MADRLSRRAVAMLALLIGLAWFGTLDYRRLIKPDEGRYAEISREMVVTGDWLTPRLNGIKYFEKPPLQYWTTAAAFKVFGLNEWTARFWTGLTGFLTLALVWWAGRRLLGAPAGDYAALILASNVYFVLLGHFNSLDMGLALFTTLALLAFCLAQREGAAPVEQRRWMVLAWAAAALAVLSKGLVGIVLPGMALLAYSLLARDWSLWRRLAIWPGAVVFLGIALPWFAAVSLANPEFPRAFFLEQHVLRYATDIGRREAPPYYFAGVLVVGMLPWTLLMLNSLWSEAKAGFRRPPEARTPAMLLAWIAVVVVFFTVSKSKLPSYVLPVFPALALLMGKQVAELPARSLIRWIVPVGVAALVAPFFVARAAPSIADPVLRPLMEQYAWWLYAALLVTVAGALYCWRKAAAGAKAAAMAGASAAAFAASLLIVNGHDSFAPSLSSHGIAEKLRPLVRRDVPFYSIRTYDQTLPFYLERTFTLVQFRDELDYGLRQEPQLAIEDLGEFRSRWSAQARAYALLRPEDYEALRGEGLPMEVVAADARRVVIGKPEAAR